MADPTTRAEAVPLTDEREQEIRKIANAAPLRIMMEDVVGCRVALRELLAEIDRIRHQRRFLIDQLRRKDARSGDGDRALREFLGGEERVAAVPDCLFCRPNTPDNQVIATAGTCYARADNFPAAPGHLEIVPYRHVESLFDLTPAEAADVWRLLREAAAQGTADGWTIGVNEGRAAGRTVDHVHIHLIPRRHGDVPDPRGGVRNVLPGGDPNLWSTPVQPPADRAALRDRIARVLASAELKPPFPHCLAMADAVLAVLPEPAEAHRLALSEALGLDTSAPWDAIYDRATELALPPLDQDPVAQRLGLVPAAADRTAAMFGAAEIKTRPELNVRPLPAQALTADETVTPADRAAVLREAADWYAGQGKVVLSASQVAAEGVNRAVSELRRMADETPAATEAHPAEHSWAAELYDPLTDEWAPSYTSHVRERAMNALEHARTIGPTWKDGTPTQRRLVRATTTYTVEPEHALTDEAQQPKEA